MGIDYALEFGCPPRDALSTEPLVTLVKQRRQIDALLSGLPAGKSPSEISVQRVVIGPRGPVQRSSTLRQMQDETLVLDAHAAACTGCAANGLKTPYGCVDYIPYPIASSTEAWALSLLPEAAESTAGVFLRTALREMNYNGRSARELRSRNAGIFARPDAAVRRWADGTALTFDQLFEMLFMVERIDPPHGVILLLLTGVLSHDLPPEELLRIQQDDSFRASALERPQVLPAGLPEPEGPLFRYLDALRRAAAIGAGVLISY